MWSGCFLEYKTLAFTLQWLCWIANSRVGKLGVSRSEKVIDSGRHNLNTPLLYLTRNEGMHNTLSTTSTLGHMDKRSYQKGYVVDKDAFWISLCMQAGITRQLSMYRIRYFSHIISHPLNYFVYHFPILFRLLSLTCPSLCIFTL